MKVSLNWIKKYTDIDVSTDELVKLATERLGGIEGTIDLSKHYDGLVVVKVVSCVKHPNADKLSLCKIDDGGVVKDVARDENGYVQVVCGAPNVREGILVAWIPPSAVVPASYGEKELFVLEARELRGELSNGMLASPAELGMSDDHDGILEIEEDAKPGTAFKELYDLDDTILEIENKMFTHRPDGFGHLGVAREIAGIQHKAFKSPDWYLNPSVKTGENDKLSVQIESEELSPRYMAVVLEDVEIKPSPVWLQSYLKRVGVRPINNVVDITNYIMLLTAQPLHAFDFDKVAVNGKVEISVRRPKEGEKMTLLDGKTIEPHKDAALICNTDGPIALAGVMGGGNSEVDANTKRIVLECATFNMYGIRKTSMIHGIFTDAVTRFTKGQPAAQLPVVISEAIKMFEELAGAKQSGDIVDVSATTKELNDQPIEIEAKFINDRLGSKFSAEEIVTLLNNVEIQAHEASGPIEVNAPFWRTDLEIKEDIVEEIGRLYGFNQLPMALPQKSITPVTPDNLRSLKSKIRTILSRAGANEVLTYSFVHGNLLQKVGQKPENSYAIRNALSPDLQYYRQSLTPSLLELVHPNIKTGNDEFGIFEIGKSHNKIHGLDEAGVPGEIEMTTFVYANKKGKDSAFYHARRVLDYLAASLSLELEFAPINDPVDFPVTAPFNQARSALVSVKGSKVFLGIIGEYTSELIKKLKLPEFSAGFEIGTDHLLEAVQHETDNTYRPLSRYESSKQDITLKVAEDVSFAVLKTLLESQLDDSEYNWSLLPLGVYQKEGDVTKNMSFRITLNHDDRTLVSEEVTKLVEKISWRAHEELNAEQV